MSQPEVRTYHAPATADGGGALLALVIGMPTPADRPGATFHTDDADPLQVATIAHPPGFEVRAHYHPPVARYVATTSEVLHVTHGGAWLDLYDPATNAVAHSVQLHAGTTVVLFGSGHGLRGFPWDDFVAVEVKQGPYPGQARDKVYLDGPHPRPGDRRDHDHVPPGGEGEAT